MLCLSQDTRQSSHGAHGVKLWDLDVITVAQGLVIQMRRSKWISRLHHKPANTKASMHFSKCDCTIAFICLNCWPAPCSRLQEDNCEGPLRTAEKIHMKPSGNLIEQILLCSSKEHYHFTAAGSRDMTHCDMTHGPTILRLEYEYDCDGLVVNTHRHIFAFSGPHPDKDSPAATKTSFKVR